MSFKLETAKRLHDAVAACEELLGLTKGRTREEFLADRLLQLAVWKLIEIVGEALRRAELSEPAIIARIPELRDVVNTRNRITHGYDSVNFNLLWDIAQEDIPILLVRLRGLVSTQRDDSSCDR